MTDELFKKIEDLSNEIKYIERVDDIDYIRIKDVEYGLKDLTKKLSSEIEESKVLTKEQKQKEFRKVIPSFEHFKNLIIENNGLIKIEGMFYVDMTGYINKPIEPNFLLGDIEVEPKYWNAGIESIIYSYIERFIKEMGYESILTGVIGIWQNINFYKKEGFFPVYELDEKYVLPLLETLNNEYLEITDMDGDLYIIPMHKYIGSGDIIKKIRYIISPIDVQYLKNQIAKSNDGRIRMLVADMAKAMGMTGYEDSIYWGLKYVLFSEGIFLTMEQTINYEPAFVMRGRVEEDVLPEFYYMIET